VIFTTLSDGRVMCDFFPFAWLMMGKQSITINFKQHHDGRGRRMGQQQQAVLTIACLQANGMST
jgi:hypothetical protein